MIAEETDTRLLRRVVDAVQNRWEKASTYTVDTDVVVFVMASFNTTASDELLVAFGVSSSVWQIMHSK